MKTIIFLSTLMLSASAFASTSNNSFFTLMASCSGWPHERGTGTIEFYRDLRTMDSESVFVRTNQENGSYGSINISSALADDAWNENTATVWRDKDPQNLTSSFRVVLTKGLGVKTPFFQNGVHIADLTCNALQ